MRKVKVKCPKCGTKNRPRFFCNTKKKWVYFCENKECKLKKYTKKDNRTIEEKYDREIIIFIRLCFNKKHMSYEYNEKIIANRILESEKSTETEREKARKVIEKMNNRYKPWRRSPKVKRVPYSRNFRSYPFTYIHELTKKKFLEVFPNL